MPPTHAHTDTHSQCPAGATCTPDPHMRAAHSACPTHVPAEATCPLHTHACTLNPTVPACAEHTHAGRAHSCAHIHTPAACHVDVEAVPCFLRYTWASRAVLLKPPHPCASLGPWLFFLFILRLSDLWKDYKNNVVNSHTPFTWTHQLTFCHICSLSLSSCPHTLPHIYVYVSVFPLNIYKYKVTYIFPLTHLGAMCRHRHTSCLNTNTSRLCFLKAKTLLL